MRIRLVVTTPDLRCDTVVDAPEGTDLGGIRRAVATACGVGDELPWWTGRRPLPASAVLGGPGLRAGDEVSIGAAGPARPDPSALHLAVVGGPGAGTVLPLRRGVHVVGRADDCDLPLPDSGVSHRHLAVTVTTARVTVRDLDSHNGTHRGRGLIDRDGDDLRPGDTVRIGHSRLVLRTAGPPAAAVRPTGDGRVLVPRAAARAVTGGGRITAPTPPTATSRPRVALVAALLPAFAAAGLAWFLHTWQLLAFAALTPLTVLGTAAGDRWSWRTSRRRAAAAHATAVTRFCADRDTALARERRDRESRHPDAAAGFAAASAPAASLWDRRDDDPDRWHVRLGAADRPSVTRVLRPDHTEAPAGGLAAVPVCADLGRGPLGVVGPAGPAGAVARAVVAQLVLAHGPGALEVVAVLSDPGGRDWDWLAWLPHRVRRLTTPAAVRTLVATLGPRVAAARADRPGPAVTTTTPTLLVVDRAGVVADVPGFDDLLARGARAGVPAVCVDRTDHALPGACAAVARTTGATHALLTLHGSGWDTPDGRPDVTGPVLADLATREWCEELARRLAPLADPAASAGPPDRVRLRELVPLTGVADVAAAWERPTVTVRPLRAVVAAGRAGPVHLDLGADGPHALVAGTTGSGKSELLRTWVVALAAAHPPDDLRFLLVDYKGGAAFGACARLPHVAGVVTDLDPHLTTRVLRSLEAELHRRERAFAAVGAADLDAHRRTGAGPVVPRLVVVVDEFATLAADLPDFLPGLVDVAQRGRSLGVHLVVATQRPGAAVSPAIRANTTLRIALRVTDPGESSDVVGVPDAAGLDPRLPGRALLRTGRGCETVQTAHVGGPVPGAVAPVSAHRVGPWEDPPAADPAPGDRTDLDDVVDLVLAAWADRAATGVAAPAALWHPPLPDELDDAAAGRSTEATGGRHRTVDRGNATLLPVIGRRDEPGRQRQVPEVLDLRAGGTLLVAGASRCGRTTLLRTVEAAGAAAGVPSVVVGLAPGDDPPATRVAWTPADDAATLARLLDLLEAEFAARGPVDAGDAEPLLLLVDGLGAVASTLDGVDGGRETERWWSLLRAAGSRGITVVATGDRSVLAPRVTGCADRVLLLRPADPGDATALGLAGRDLPTHWPPGRGVWVPEGDVVQLVRPGPARVTADVRPTRTGLRLRPLPATASLPRRTAPDDGPPRLGVGGDEALPVGWDLWAGARRWLVAGPPRSGRSGVLALLTAEAAAAGATVRWWARPHSPVAAMAARVGAAALVADEPVSLTTGGRTLVVLDDVDDLADTVLADSLVDLLQQATAPPAVVIAGRADDLLVSFRGLVAEVRRAHRGLLLRPGPGDGELVGIRTARASGTSPPGRGLLVADGVRVGAHPVAVGPVRVQVARVEPADVGGPA